MSRRALLVEDDAGMAVVLRKALQAAGLEVTVAPSAELALKAARERAPDLVLLDVHLPGRSGLDVLPELLAQDPAPAVVVLTAHPTAETAMDALARGAAAHLSKPVDPEQLRATVARVLAGRAAAAEDEPPAPAQRLVGRSPAMLELGQRVGALARSEVNVLIRGESGTGKELVARAIHERSQRASQPLVAVSCAVLPEALFEAELFGRERGAYTGADRAQAGRVERARGGTLFLDEVGELTPRSQAKLLRFLEERTFERVGGGRELEADVRVIAATNATLEDAVEEGAFREDLYYRLDVARVEVPPLRERREDIPLLVEHFLAQAGRAGLDVTPGALAALRARPWPGNVRELRNAVQSALLTLGSGPTLTEEHLGQAPARAEVSEPEERRLRDALRALVARGAPDDAPEGLFARLQAVVERELIAAALEATGGNQVAATRLLGMNRATLRRKMAQYGLR